MNTDQIVKAIKNDDLNSFQTLIAAVANVWANQYSIKGYSELLPLSGLSFLHLSAFYDSIECFKYLHEERQFTLRHPSLDNLPPIYYACCKGSTKVVKYILSKDPTQSQLNLLGPRNRSLLFLAIYGNTEIIDELLKNGAKLTDPWNDQYSILCSVIALHKIDLFILLYKLLPPNYQPTPGEPSFIEKAIFDNNIPVIEFLIEEEHIDFTQVNNAYLIKFMIELDSKQNFKNILIKILSKDTENIPLELANAGRSDLLTACDHACSYLDLDVAKLIFKTKDFDINRFNERHQTGAYWLINCNDTSKVCDMIKLLIENGFNVNNRYDENSKTLLESFVTAIKKNYYAIKLLIEYGADTNALLAKNAKYATENLSIFKYVTENSRDSRLKDIFNQSQ